LHAAENKGVVVDHHDQLAAQRIGNGLRPHRRLRSGRRCRDQRHRNGEPRALAKLRGHLDGVLEKPTQPVDNCKSKTEPAAIPFSTWNLIELTENVTALILRNADAAVPDLDVHDAHAATAADRDAAADRVANRVGYQIEEYAFEQNEIAADDGLT